jgi:hypothetical protein
MDIFYNTAQITADYTLSTQKYLWSLIGITPTQEFSKASPPGPAIHLYKNNCNFLGFEISMCSRRLAGISGAAAVILSAYGAHKGKI